MLSSKMKSDLNKAIEQKENSEFIMSILFKSSFFGYRPDRPHDKYIKDVLQMMQNQINDQQDLNAQNEATVQKNRAYLQKLESGIAVDMQHKKDLLSQAGELRTKIAEVNNRQYALEQEKDVFDKAQAQVQKNSQKANIAKLIVASFLDVDTNHDAHPEDAEVHISGQQIDKCIIS